VAHFVSCCDVVAETELEPGENPVELALSAANEAFELCRSELEPEPEQCRFSNLAELAEAARAAETELLGVDVDVQQQNLFYEFLKQGGGPCVENQF
jgi:hypothetical protein